jgi:hypothetical protein
MKFVIYSDPSHAWCKVRRDLLVKLGITNEITSFSYLRGDYVYLEEDYDLSLLVSTLKDKGIPVQFDERHTNKSSKIRSYTAYIRK